MFFLFFFSLFSFVLQICCHQLSQNKDAERREETGKEGVRCGERRNDMMEGEEREKRKKGGAVGEGEDR